MVSVPRYGQQRVAPAPTPGIRGPTQATGAAASAKAFGAIAEAVDNEIKRADDTAVNRALGAYSQEKINYSFGDDGIYDKHGDDFIGASAGTEAWSLNTIERLGRNLSPRARSRYEKLIQNDHTSLMRGVMSHASGVRLKLNEEAYAHLSNSQFTSSAKSATHNQRLIPVDVSPTGPEGAAAETVRGWRSTPRMGADGRPQTVLLASGDSKVWPTLFPDLDNPGEWIDFVGDAKAEAEANGDDFTEEMEKEAMQAARVEAEKRGEVIEFGTKEEAERFALGSWKSEEMQFDMGPVHNDLELSISTIMNHAALTGKSKWWVAAAILQATQRIAGGYMTAATSAQPGPNGVLIPADSAMATAALAALGPMLSTAAGRSAATNTGVLQDTKVGADIASDLLAGLDAPLDFSEDARLAAKKLGLEDEFVPWQDLAQALYDQIDDRDDLTPRQRQDARDELDLLIDRMRQQHTEERVRLRSKFTDLTSGNSTTSSMVKAEDGYDSLTANEQASFLARAARLKISNLKSMPHFLKLIGWAESNSIEKEDAFLNTDLKAEYSHLLSGDHMKLLLTAQDELKAEIEPLSVLGTKQRAALEAFITSIVGGGWNSNAVGADMDLNHRGHIIMGTVRQWLLAAQRGRTEPWSVEDLEAQFNEFLKLNTDVIGLFTDEESWLGEGIATGVIDYGTAVTVLATMKEYGLTPTIETLATISGLTKPEDIVAALTQRDLDAARAEYTRQTVMAKVGKGWYPGMDENVPGLVLVERPPLNRPFAGGIVGNMAQGLRPTHRYELKDQFISSKQRNRLLGNEAHIDEFGVYRDVPAPETEEAAVYREEREAAAVVAAKASLDLAENVETTPGSRAANRMELMRPVKVPFSDGTTSQTLRYGTGQDAKGDTTHFAFPMAFPKNPDEPLLEESGYIIWTAREEDDAHRMAQDRGEVIYFSSEDAAVGFVGGTWRSDGPSQFQSSP